MIPGMAISLTFTAEERETIADLIQIESYFLGRPLKTPA